MNETECTPTWVSGELITLTARIAALEDVNRQQRELNHDLLDMLLRLQQLLGLHPEGAYETVAHRLQALAAREA